MDAATNLNKVKLTTEGSDGCWFSKNAISLLAGYLADEARPVQDALMQAAGELRAELDRMGANGDVAMYPSGSVLIVRECKDKIELYSLGDCSAIIRFRNGEQDRYLHDDAVTKLDNAVIARLQELHRESGRAVAELLPDVDELLRENRAKRNRENGYWIFDPTGTGVEHGQRYEWPKEIVKDVTLMSDGFCCLADQEADLSLESLVKRLEQEPAERIVTEIFTCLEGDPLFNRYPRFKMKDDASVIYAQIDCI